MRQSGFTLVELMVVLAIVGILMAIGIPHLRAHILESRLDSALPRLAQIQARQRIHFIENGTYCCDGSTTSEDTLDTGLGLRVEENGDFCFVFVCTDTNLCQSTVSGGFISPTEVGDPTPEFEVWAILRQAGGTVTGPNSVSCTPHTSKRAPEGWVAASASGETGRQGQAVVLRYPAPLNGVDTATSARGIAHVWSGGISLTDAMLP